MHGLQLPTREWSRRIFTIAVPAAIQALLRVFSLTAFTLVLRSVPNASAAIAGMGIAFAIESIMFMPAFGLSAASGALVGQSLGMGKPERAEKLAWTAAHFGALVTLCMVVPIYFTAPEIALKLVGGKADIAIQASALIRALCATELFFSYAMVMIGAMQGAGDTIRPMWISVICMWGLRVPLAILCAITFGFGSAGAWVAMSFTQGVQGIMAIWVFRKGAWKTVKV